MRSSCHFLHDWLLDWFLDWFYSFLGLSMVLCFVGWILTLITVTVDDGIGTPELDQSITVSQYHSITVSQ